MEKLIVGDEDCSFNEIVSELELLPTSSVFVYDWRKLAKGLDIPNMKEAILEQDLLLKRKQPIDIIVDLLLEWRSRQGNSATMATLLQILQNRCKWKEMADSLRNKYKLKIYDTTQWNDLDAVTKSEILNLQVDFLNTRISLHQCLSFFDESLQQNLIAKHLKGLLLHKLLKFQTDPFSFTTATIPDKPKYYVPRTITTRRQIDPLIFTTFCSDIFIFEDINFPDLSKLADNERVDRSTSQLKKLSVRFILLEFEEDFENICKIANHASVHLIVCDNEKLIWKRTHGSLWLIQQYIHEEQECIPEDEFVEMLGDTEDQLPVCISDSPGMGKSVLLANMARNLSSRFTNRIAVYVPISDFIKTVNHDYNSELKWSKIGALISLYLAANDFGCDILTNLINNPAQKIDLFFDGFDEILPDQEKIAMLVLNCILNQKRNIRLIVSTRPHKLSLLENTLGTLGFNIEAFNTSDQITFLEQYWWHTYKIQVNSNLNDFASYLVDVLTENFEKGGKASSEIAGIPLQCAILADIYEKDARKYSKVKKAIFTITVQISTIADMYEALMKTKFLRCKEIEKRELLRRAHVFAAFVVLFPDWINIFEFFEVSVDNLDNKEICTIGVIERIDASLTNNGLPIFRFVHRTYAEYFVAEFLMENLLTSQQTLENDNLNAEILMNFMFSEIFQLNQFDNNLIVARKGCAVIYIANILKDVHGYEDCRSNWVSLAKYLGLDESTIADLAWRLQYLLNNRERIDPIHKLMDTWVNVFGKKSQLSRLTESLEHCQWNRLSDALKSKFYTTCFRYPNISYFLESQLELNIDQVISTISNNGMSSYVENSYYDILKCCVTLEYTSLFKLVSQLFIQSELNSNDKEILPQILCFAAEFSTSNLFVECCEFVETVVQKPIHELKFVWTIHTQMMNYVKCTPLHIAVWYGKEGIVDYLIKKYGKCMSSLKCLLHFLVGDSLNDSDGKILQKLGIAKMLLENSPIRLNEKDNLERTPIYAGKIHFKLLEYFINVGASVYPIPYGGRTIAHNAAVMYNPNDFHLFCVLILNKKLDKLFRMQTEELRSTPVHTALSTKEVKIETVELLASNLHLDFNVLDSYMDSELFVAVKGGRNRKILEALVKHGADWKKIRHQGLGILHYAGWFGNVEAMEYFISLGADVNARDEFGETPLHSVLKLGRKNVHDIVLLLVENNADVNIIDKNDFTPQMYGLLGKDEYRIEERTIELLVSTASNQEVGDIGIGKQTFWSRCKECLCSYHKFVNDQNK